MATPTKYATVEDVLRRTTRTFTNDEKSVMDALLEDAAVRIDAFNKDASEAAKLSVSCSMVLRSMPDDGLGVPMGATQGSMAAGGYSQSWTNSNGGSGELYLTRQEKSLLGGGSRIGSRSPLERCGHD